MTYGVGAVLLFLEITIFYNVCGQSEFCPASADCVDVQKCPALLSTFNRNSDYDILRRNQCGFDGISPKVCCPKSPAKPPTHGRNSEKVKNALLPDECGLDPISNRIFGGNVTDLEEYPWLVLIEYKTLTKKKETVCDGALISKRYVLTAAHCLVGKEIPKGWTPQSVRLGEYDTSRDPDCVPNGDAGFTCNDKYVSIGIEEQIVHEQFSRLSRDQHNDIALLRLSRDVKYTNFIKPICLPNTGDIAEQVQIAGWGKTAYKAYSDVKMKVTLPLANQEFCRAVYKDININLGPSQMCIGGESGRDACTGDSGGPVMQLSKVADGTIRWKAVGIVSFGPSPCGMQDWPGVYTKVYNYVPWIHSKIRA